MKKIIITGASGLVATELTLLLLSKTEAQLYLLSTRPDNIVERYKQYPDRVYCFTLESFSHLVRQKQGDMSFDICIHTAFARSNDGHLIAQSLEYQQELISILKDTTLKVFINISAQSVDGKFSESLWTEAVPVAPDYLYAMGKYTSEIITKQMLGSTDIRWTNIRLCSVCENARFVRIFVLNALEGKPIHLTAPDQHCSFIDVRDVAEGLLCLINCLDSAELDPVYNLGANLVCSIRNVAFKVKEIGEKLYNLPPITITESESDNHTRIGMSANLFMQTFGWTHRYTLDDMVVSMFNMLTKNEEKEYPQSFQYI